MVGTDVAAADPLPGFDLDPVQLAAPMDDCLSFRSGKDEILMGWVRLSTGERRTWRCSSLRHMMRYDGSAGEAHDPYVDVADLRGAPPGSSVTVSRGPVAARTRQCRTHQAVQRNRQSGNRRCERGHRGHRNDLHEPQPDDWTGCAYAP